MRFTRRYYGVRVTSPHGLGGQCVDLVQMWYSALVGAPGPSGNAVDWAWRNLPHFDWVPNAPHNAPSPCDIVVWGRAPAVGIGPDGHIAIALSADDAMLLTLDQNWPAGANVAAVAHLSYAGVLGWHTPNRALLGSVGAAGRR